MLAQAARSGTATVQLGRSDMDAVPAQRGVLEGCRNTRG